MPKDPRVTLWKMTSPDQGYFLTDFHYAGVSDLDNWGSRIRTYAYRSQNAVPLPLGYTPIHILVYNWGWWSRTTLYRVRAGRSTDNLIPNNGDGRQSKPQPSEPQSDVLPLELPPQCEIQGSNLWLLLCKSSTLPAELISQIKGYQFRILNQ